MWNEAQSRMDAYPSVVGTLGGGEPVGLPRMNLEMHLHLNSELGSNEFLTEFAFKIRKIPSGFALVRQCREQATAGRTHASMSVGGHALPPHPLILKWLHPAPPPHTPPPPPHHHHYPSLPNESSQQHCLRRWSLRIPEAFCFLVCIMFYDHICFY